MRRLGTSSLLKQKLFLSPRVFASELMCCGNAAPQRHSPAKCISNRKQEQFTSIKQTVKQEQGENLLWDGYGFLNIFVMKRFALLRRHTLVNLTSRGWQYRGIFSITTQTSVGNFQSITHIVAYCTCFWIHGSINLQHLACNGYFFDKLPQTTKLVEETSMMMIPTPPLWLCPNKKIKEGLPRYDNAAFK